MRVGLDVSAAAGEATGVGVYARQLAVALAREAPRDRFVVACFAAPGRASPRLEPWPNLEPCRSRVPYRLIGRAWRALDRPAVERFIGPVDVFHSTWFTIPAARAPRVLTVSDLLPWRHPGWGPPDLPPWPRYRRLLGRADRVIAISEFTGSELLAMAPEVEGRLRVVRCGVDLARYRPPAAAEVETLARGLGLCPGRYFLVVSRQVAAKNLPRVAAAFRRAAPAGFELVHAGPGGPLEGVRPLGYLPDEAMPALYGGAAALLLLSLYEGFGIQVLEAMACGTPVICSDRGGPAEVGGEAALRVCPEDDGAMAEAIAAVAAGGPLRDRLAAAGPARAALFGWDRCARETLAVYRELVP
ncbi:MAG: glycosyltransferase [Planctomycetes bacterium]|nr:glycosyltransferase [Planctomycetota bacterium]